MEPHTIIALELNGRPVPHLHGGPARLIVPGWVGSASIKWLTEITLAQKEWDGPFMARSYRSPRVDDPKESYSLTSLECKSIVLHPADGAQLTAGTQTVHGFAWAGEGAIVAVDVSTDGVRPGCPRVLLARSTDTPGGGGRRRGTPRPGRPSSWREPATHWAGSSPHPGRAIRRDTAGM